MLDKTEKEFTDFLHDIRSDATKSNYTRTLDQFISWTQTLEKKNQFKSYSALSKTTKAEIQPILESYIQFLSDEKYPNSVPKYLDGMIRMGIIEDDADVFHLEATKFPTSSEEEVHISVKEWN